MKFLDDSNTNVSDVSFLKKIKIKELNLYACINIKNFFFISKWERLEILKISGSTNISDLSRKK